MVERAMTKGRLAIWLIGTHNGETTTRAIPGHRRGQTRSPAALRDVNCERLERPWRERITPRDANRHPSMTVSGGR